MGRLVTLAILTLASAPAGAGTKLTVGEMNVDGQTILELDCDLDNGGFLASAVLVGTIAKQKKALDRCGPKGEAFRVAFVWAGGKTTAIEVLATSAPGAKTCVAKAFAKLAPELNGRCSAVLLTGDAATAKRAAAKLPPPKKTRD